MNNSKITREPDLSQNLGLLIYNDNWAAQQNIYAVEVFETLLKSEKFDRVLEIGTSLGGLTFILHDIKTNLQQNFAIKSYDILDRPVEYGRLRDLGVDITVSNPFDIDYSNPKSDVIDFIRNEGRVLVLCDGGNKIKEFNCLSRFLKTNDVIMAHDYAFNSNDFEHNINRKYWNWHEISDSDISEACTTYNLVPFMQEEFSKAVWACRIKN
jgi:hypothetical protein